ncbi:hypothetical protein [Acinetobacter calcoaceticus]|uniref:hypothetical protein n=1 Tax=Acinetobacter calcoaceticus TaxID=471 RepID=UPI0012BAC4D4|nr:hypothetical protein [Acinetobacter calcoaceticus]
MIDLNKEREAFEAEWKNLGGNLNSFQIVNKMYVLTENVQSAGPIVKELSERAINSAFALWLIQAKQKNTVIEQLTADLEKAQAVPTWISLEDEEPPADTIVLICWSDTPDVQPESDYMTCDEDLNHIWANFERDPPTHWMYFHTVPSKSGAEQ